MNPNPPGYDACLFHPEIGNEAIPGRMTVDRYAVRFQSETVAEEIPADRVEIGLEDATDRICFTDSARPELKLFTFDADVLDHPALERAGFVRETLGARAAKRELRRRIRLTLYFFLGCILIACVGSWATGVAVVTLAHRVPPEFERTFGDKEIARMKEGGELLEDSNRVAQLTALAEPLMKVIPTGKTKVKFHIAKTSVANAVALPGGHVVVTMGMLDMVDEPEELLGVIAHEMGHVTEKHFARGVISASGPILIFGVLLHSQDQLLNTLSEASGVMIWMGYSQEFEREADNAGWQYLLDAHIDPRGMVSVFRKMKKQEDLAKAHGAVELPEAFHDHPALEKRIQWLDTKWDRLRLKAGFIQPRSLDGIKPGPDDLRYPDARL